MNQKIAICLAILFTTSLAIYNFSYGVKLLLKPKTKKVWAILRMMLGLLIACLPLWLSTLLMDLLKAS